MEPDESWRTGPWPPPSPAPFVVPGLQHVLLSPLPGIPETACGADPQDITAARRRCRAEAVERSTAWHPRAAPVLQAGAVRSRLRPEQLADASCPALPCGEDVAVHELTDARTPAEAHAVDRAAVCLGTGGWFPAGSTGLAASGTVPGAIRAAAWELLERDLLTRWWRGELPAVQEPLLPADPPRGTDDAAGGAVGGSLAGQAHAHGIDLHAIRIQEHCVAVAASDDELRLTAVGASAGADRDRCREKACAEALITLAQLREMLTAADGGTGIPPLPPDRRALDLPPEQDTGLEHTLRALGDPRFAARIRARFTEAQPLPHLGTTEGGDARRETDPVLVLRGRGHRVLAARLDSPQARWAGLAVVRVLATGAQAPMPRCARPAELPVPLA